MAEQTLDVRDQTLEGEVVQKDQMHQKIQKDQKFQKDQKDQKDQKLDSVQWPSTGGSQITSRYKRARALTLQEFCVFCCHKCHTSTITHYVITIYTDNRNNIQKISHFHAATPPKKHTKTPSSKQLFDLPSQTTRHFPQNDTLFSIKRHVTFHKTTRRFWDDEVFSIPSAVTLVTAKKQNSQYESAHTRAHENLRPIPNHPLIQSNQPIHSPTLPNPPQKKHSPTKKYSSAMKQPSTNHSSKPILICTT